MFGMMWFDNDPKRSFDEKVISAATYYSQKYGQVATLCTVHPTMYPVKLDQEYQVGEIRIKHSRLILPCHLWLCVDQAEQPPVQLAPSEPAREDPRTIKQLSFLEAS